MKHNVNSNLRATAGCIALVSCAVAGMTFAAQRPVLAQAAETKSQQPVTLNFQGGDIQAVLKALFNDIGANYSIDSDVHGTVSISMTNVGFLAALRSVLRANNPPLTFDFTDGVYHIRVRQQEKPAGATTTTDTTSTDTSGSTTGDQSSGDNSTGNMRYFKIPVDNFDVRQMAAFISSMDKKVVEIVPSNGGGGSGSTSGNIGVVSGAGGGTSGSTGFSGGGMTGGIGGGVGGMR